MGDSGEGLVDAEARIQEQIEEREAERRRRGGGGPKIDPEKVRELESLRLAKSNLEQQAETTEHPVRKQQIKLAIAEIDKRLARSSSSGSERHHSDVDRNQALNSRSPMASLMRSRSVYSSAAVIASIRKTTAAVIDALT